MRWKCTTGQRGRLALVDDPVDRDVLDSKLSTSKWYKSQSFSPISMSSAGLAFPWVVRKHVPLADIGNRADAESAQPGFPQTLLLYHGKCTGREQKQAERQKSVDLFAVCTTIGHYSPCAINRYCRAEKHWFSMTQNFFSSIKTKYEMVTSHTILWLFLTSILAGMPNIASSLKKKSVTSSRNSTSVRLCSIRSQHGAAQ